MSSWLITCTVKSDWSFSLYHLPRWPLSFRFPHVWNGNNCFIWLLQVLSEVVPAVNQNSAGNIIHKQWLVDIILLQDGTEMYSWVHSADIYTTSRLSWVSQLCLTLLLLFLSEVTIREQGGKTEWLLSLQTSRVLSTLCFSPCLDCPPPLFSHSPFWGQVSYPLWHIL